MSKKLNISDIDYFYFYKDNIHYSKFVLINDKFPDLKAKVEECHVKVTILQELINDLPEEYRERFEVLYK